MSLSSSSQQTDQAHLGRRFAIIPKDQLQILDQDGAWAVDPSDRRDVPLLPIDILQDITSRHLMKWKAVKQTADQVSPSTKDVLTKNHHPRLHVEGNDVDAVGHDHFDEIRSQEQQGDDEGSLISGWSASPIRDSLQSPTSAPEALNFHTQVPDAMPHVDQRTADLSETQVATPIPAVRQSLRLTGIMGGEEDDDDEVEMEVDLPGVRESPQARVNLESARMQMMASTPAAPVVTQITSNDTPTCAQPDQRMIPGTVLEKPSPVRQGKGLKRRCHRRMRPIQFEEDTPVKCLEPFSVGRLPTTSRLDEEGSSMFTSSSSLIPATCATMSTQNSVVGRIAATQILATGNASPLNAISMARAACAPLFTQDLPAGNAAATQISATGQASPPSAAQQSDEAVSLQKAACASISTHNSGADNAAATQIPATNRAAPPSPPQQVHDAAPIQRPSAENLPAVEPEPSPPPKDMYSLFTSTYLSYTTTHAGTLKNFIKALLCLEYLQSERGLHEFLYDDFIRAFSSAYLQYVRNAGPGQEALPAVEWFNLRGGQPEFSRMIITKGGVNAALEEFPEEVALARQYIRGGGPQQETRPSREPKRPDEGEPMDIDRTTSPTRETSAASASGAQSNQEKPGRSPSVKTRQTRESSAPRTEAKPAERSRSRPSVNNDPKQDTSAPGPHTRQAYHARSPSVDTHQTRQTSAPGPQKRQAKRTRSPSVDTSPTRQSSTSRPQTRRAKRARNQSVDTNPARQTLAAEPQIRQAKRACSPARGIQAKETKRVRSPSLSTYQTRPTRAPRTQAQPAERACIPPVNKNATRQSWAPGTQARRATGDSKSSVSFSRLGPKNSTISPSTSTSRSIPSVSFSRLGPKNSTISPSTSTSRLGPDAPKRSTIRSSTSTSRLRPDANKQSTIPPSTSTSRLRAGANKQPRILPSTSTSRLRADANKQPRILPSTSTSRLVTDANQRSSIPPSTSSSRPSNTPTASNGSLWLSLVIKDKSMRPAPKVEKGKKDEVDESNDEKLWKLCRTLRVNGSTVSGR
ncbi:hypothetical protein E4U57_007472 [Claviceps arundinis]|uniref:Uncharacterized protein n=1 Tax=Claviceps arundinis TaxID=1623583 RepID=A0A9P7MQH0_9HYPO|nr:hypothetical protein E4U57_007472 [Claviceps arundinis]KAG5964927.1 hypothetical protein E4U56_002035 [Claviceps arundinis]